MNIANHLERASRFFPDRPAVAEDGVVTTYRELDSKASAIAQTLSKLGIDPGESIGLCAPNSTFWLSFYFGALKAGCVAVTFSHQLKPEELHALLNATRPRLICTTSDRLETLDAAKKEGFLKGIVCPGGDLEPDSFLTPTVRRVGALQRKPWETAAVLFTGGTTGLPKGVMLTHENITVSSHNISYCERSSYQDRALCFLPFNHVFGQIHIMNATIFSAGCLELLPSFDQERVLYTLEKGYVTKFYAVPTIYVRLLGIKDLRSKLGGVRYCFSAAASLASEIIREWHSETGLTIHEGYGLTETASAVTYNHHIRHRIGSVGQEVPGVEVELRDQQGNPVAPGKEGEICIRGRNIMAGYLGDENETKGVFWEDGWFRSGDMGVFDEDRYLYIVDRIKDMIITGGENVYPREVEEALYTRQDIRECAVLGLQDKEWGERVTAVIVPKPGSSPAPEDIKNYLKTRLAPYKVPKNFIIVDELPRSGAGKVLKRELKERLIKDFFK